MTKLIHVFRRAATWARSDICSAERLGDFPNVRQHCAPSEGGFSRAGSSPKQHEDQRRSLLPFIGTWYYPDLHYSSDIREFARFQPSLPKWWESGGSLEMSKKIPLTIAALAVTI